MEKVLVSACLIGKPVRYSGGDARVVSENLSSWIAEGRAIAVCPEVSAGQSVPRPPAEIIRTNGFSVLDGFAAVVDSLGNDVTTAMIEGARNALHEALSHRVKVAVLTDGNPSRGRTYIYDGTFRGIRKRGEPNVTAALLPRNGITVFSEYQIEEADQRLRRLETRS